MKSLNDTIKKTTLIKILIACVFLFFVSILDDPQHPYPTDFCYGIYRTFIYEEFFCTHEHLETFECESAWREAHPLP